MNLACVKYFCCRYKKRLKTSGLVFKEQTNKTVSAVLSIKAVINKIY